MLGLLLGFLMSANIAQSQPIRFSLYLSPLLSTTETDFLVDASPQLKFSTGFEASYYFRENYSFSSGIQITHLGTRIRYDDKDVKMDAKYLEIPMRLKLSTDEIGYFTYYGKFGLISGFKTSEKIRVEPDPNIEDHKRYMSDMMGSLELGAGLEYNLGGQMSVFTEFSFRNNFTNAINEHNEPFSGHEKLYLNAFALTFGAIF